MTKQTHMQRRTLAASIVTFVLPQQVPYHCAESLTTTANRPFRHHSPPNSRTGMQTCVATLPCV